MTGARDGDVRVRLDEQLCFALRAAADLVVAQYASDLGRLGLSYPQYVLLMALWEHDRVPEGRVAARVRTSRAEVASDVDALVAAGLVERRRPDAAEQPLVCLTAAGAALEADALPVQASAACATTLDDDEVVALRDDLHRLIARMDDRADDVPGPAGAGAARLSRGSRLSP